MNVFNPCGQRVDLFLQMFDHAVPAHVKIALKHGVQHLTIPRCNVFVPQMKATCRTLIGYDRHGLGYKRVGRGNNVPITIILPKLGIQYGICQGKRKTPDLDGFWNAFEDTLKLTERALLERFAYMCQQSPESAPFMYGNGSAQDTELSVKEHKNYNTLRHNTLAIVYLGGAEMCQALFGANQALVDGRFKKELADKTLQFRGSSNQRLILVQASLCYGNPVLYDEKEHEAKA